MFQLTEEEKSELVANCDQFKNLKHSSSLPYAFTEHGAVMAANVLNSKVAIETSILLVRAFIRAREILAEHQELNVIRFAIQQLMEPPNLKKHPMGLDQKKKLRFILFSLHLKKTRTNSFVPSS